MQPKIALITGAGSGIGRACSIRLASLGFSVVLVGRRSKPLSDLADLIKGNGGVASPTPCDISDSTEVAACFAHVKSKYGRLDLLFNNAGANTTPTPIDELTDAQWKALVDVNLTGSFLCAREAFRMMKSQNPMGGRIINNGSISAHVPRPLATPYTATKHGVTGLTRALSLEGRPFSIACGQIDIGNVESSMTEVMKSGVLQANGVFSPEPVFNVEHVADAVAYMAGLPLDANVQFMTVMATTMPYIGRG